MSTPLPTAPTIPLSPDVRTAYEDLYAKNQAAIENTADFELLKALNASQLDIGGLLSADDQYRLNSDSAQFQAMLTQINATNDGLKALQTKIAGIAGGVAKFGAVVGAIAKVLSLIPGV
ncbi:MAG: hypothetical protein WB608_10160 [Terracidiphilus sp.]